MESPLLRLLILFRSLNKQGGHRQFLFQIGRFLKIFFSETALPNWTEICWEAPMEGSVLSFLKAEWKVSDTGSDHWASSFKKNCIQTWQKYSSMIRVVDQKSLTNCYALHTIAWGRGSFVCLFPLHFLKATLVRSFVGWLPYLVGWLVMMFCWSYPAILILQFL